MLYFDAIGYNEAKKGLRSLHYSSTIIIIIIIITAPFCIRLLCFRPFDF